MKLITNTAARARVISTIKSSAKKNVFVTDWTKARWLAEGERCVGVYRSGLTCIIHKPYANSRSDSSDMIYFYEGGVLLHEQPYSEELFALAGGAA